MVRTDFLSTSAKVPLANWDIYALLFFPFVMLGTVFFVIPMISLSKNIKKPNNLVLKLGMKCLIQLYVEE